MATRNIDRLAAKTSNLEIGTAGWYRWQSHFPIRINKMPALREIVDEVNKRAAGYAIGQLQNLRKELLGLQRKPSESVFGEVHKDRWAIHVGGRTELQFNIGREAKLREGDLRYGVAFSFETSRSLPTIDPLRPKVRLFNDYLRDFGDDLSGLLMWHHGRADENIPTNPAPICDEVIAEGVFVFMGSIGSSEKPLSIAKLNRARSRGLPCI